MPASPRPPRIRFGDVEIDVSTRELVRAGRRVRLQEKSFLVLAELLKDPGRAFTREELAAALWPKEHFVDAEQGLNAAVRRLRDALGDSAAEPRYVETLPRLGYRFIGTVERAPAEPPADPGLAAVAPSSDFSRAAPARRRILLAGALLLAACLALAAGLVLRPGAAFRPGRGHVRAGSSPGVEDLLSRARYLRNVKRYPEAKRLTEEALAKEPANADALAGLALSLLAEGREEEARGRAIRALEIDPGTWEAHRVLGVLARAAGDLAGAERHFRRSVEARPSDHKSRNRLARHLLECGRFEEARAEMRETRRLAPDDPDVQNIWISLAVQTGDYEEAIRLGELWLAVWERPLDGAPTPDFVRDQLGLAYVGARRHEEAVARFREIDPSDELRVALALAHAGRGGEARAILADHEARLAKAAAPLDPGTAGALAMAYVAAGDQDRAFLNLDRQVSAGWYPGWLSFVLFESVRRDARWPAFAERLQREFFRGARRPPVPVRYQQPLPRPPRGRPD